MNAELPFQNEKSFRDFLSETISKQGETEIKKLEDEIDSLNKEVKSGDKNQTPYWYKDKQKLLDKIEKLKGEINKIKNSDKKETKFFKIGILYPKQFKDWKLVKMKFLALAVNKQPNVKLLILEGNIEYQLKENTDIDIEVYSDNDKKSSYANLIEDSDAFIQFVSKNKMLSDYEYSNVYLLPLTTSYNKKKPIRIIEF